MRLLNTKTLDFNVFFDENTPPYAILSHRWGEDELSYQDFLTGNRKAGQGHQKVLGACKLATANGQDWIWIDSICIDKTSSAELSEAINAMFGWYGRSAICYVYLSDVNCPEQFFSQNMHIWDDAASFCQFSQSEWFTRGWTLQELLAPQNVVFYGATWATLGTRNNLAPRIEQITGIDQNVLRLPRLMFAVNVAQRMSWASSRKTTRSEDIAYSLLGIFNVNMPLLYGEGAKKAFFRLQLEIIRNTSDDSIFAWISPDHQTSGMLAPSPEVFVHSKDVKTFARPPQQNLRPWTWTNLGLELWLPEFDLESSKGPQKTSSIVADHTPTGSLFGRDIEVFTLSCWKSSSSNDKDKSDGWRFRDKVINIFLARHGPSWRRIYTNGFMLGMDAEGSRGGGSSATRSSFFRPAQPTSYRLVYVSADDTGARTNPLLSPGDPLLSDLNYQILSQSAWAKNMALSFDGGDISSYWSLLAAEKLVECITLEETDGINTLRRGHNEYAGISESGDIQSAESPEQAQSKNKYRLCHYFDSIGGAGLGGLVAIMLGQLRMSVASCLAEFEKMQLEVFWSPRLFNDFGRRYGIRPKYDASKLREFFDSLGMRTVRSKAYYSPAHHCATLIAIPQPYDQSSPGHNTPELFVIRSDTGTIRTRDAHEAHVIAERILSGEPEPRLTHGLSPLRGHTYKDVVVALSVGVVANAATTAPGYFEPTTLICREVGNDRQVERTIAHAGFGCYINPTLSCLSSSNDATGTVVSIGTAKSMAKPLAYRSFVSFRPEHVHADANAMAKNGDFEYYRIDPDVDEEDYHVTLEHPDEWDPAPSKGECGSETMAKIRRQFDRWLENPDVQNYFVECARSLVRTRRLRARDENRWNKYAGDM